MKQKTASKLNHLCLALTRCYGKKLGETPLKTMIILTK